MSTIDFLKIVDHLENNRLVINQLFHSLDHDVATWKPDGDRWSFLEILCHLVDIEREDFRVDMDIILFHPQDPWPSFSIMGWVTERAYNEQSFQEKLNQFDIEREKSIIWLRDLVSPDLDKKHSGNGFKREPLSAGDILSSWLAHDHYHIRQISLLYFDWLNRKELKYSPLYSGFER